MLEIELKATLANVDVNRLQAALNEAGFEPGQIKEEIDIYYNGNDRDFRKTDEALRLRSSREASGGAAPKTYLTYKGSKVDERSQTRSELETAVGDLQVMKALLQKLGYPEVMTIRKVRRYFEKGPVTVCLDDVSGLGQFIEVEQVEASDFSAEKKEAVVDRLLQLLHTLGIPENALLHKSYLELLMTHS